MRKNSRDRRGFTLIELLVVITILAILAALIVPRLFGHQDEAKRAKALTDITELTNALDRFRNDTDRYPTDEEGLGALLTRPSDVSTWNGPYVSKIPSDPWQHDYQYHDMGNNQVEVKSFGKDGVEGGEGDGQDISNLDGTTPSGQ